MEMALVAQRVKNPPTMSKLYLTLVQKNPEEGKDNPLHSLPENFINREPGGLLSSGLQKVGHNLETNANRSGISFMPS